MANKSDLAIFPTYILSKNVDYRPGMIRVTRQAVGATLKDFPIGSKETRRHKLCLLIVDC